MKRYSCICSVLLAGMGAVYFPLPVTASGVGPALLEINLGVVPIDKYFDANNDRGNPILPACRDNNGVTQTKWTIQECYAWIISENGKVGNYRSQGVTGVRFMYTLGGGFFSTAFDDNGLVRSGWRTNMKQFLHDLKSYGIERVSPSPMALVGWGVNESQHPNFVDHASNPVIIGTLGHRLKFVKWLNFGFIDGQYCQGQARCDDWLWDGLESNQAYNSSPANPNFWGWYDDATLGFGNLQQKYLLGVINTVLYEASQENLIVADLDIENEVMMSRGTVLARLYYDNKAGVHLYGKLREMMTKWGFGAGRVGVSVVADRPSKVEAVDCDTDFELYPGGPKDKATLLNLSSLDAAIGGRHFGMPRYIERPNGLACKGDNTCEPGNDGCRYGDMPTIAAPESLPAPDVIDIHSHVCVENALGACDDTFLKTQSYPENLYNAVWKFLTDRGRTDTYVVFGETNTNQTRNCDHSTPLQAYWNVKGFLASNLYQNRPGSAGAKTVMRPWGNISSQDGCYEAPNPLTPYASTGPPTAVSVSPVESLHAPLTFRFIDSDGYADMQSAEVNITQGAERADAGACWVRYTRATDMFYLRNDTGTGWLGPISPGSAGNVSNSQCMVTGAGLQATGSGNELSLTIPYWFGANFRGTKTVHMRTADGQLTTEWGRRGFVEGDPTVVFKSAWNDGYYAGDYGPLNEGDLQYTFTAVPFSLDTNGSWPSASQTRNGDTFVAVADQTGRVWGNIYRRATRSWDVWRMAPTSFTAGKPSIVGVSSTEAVVFARRVTGGSGLFSISFSTGMGFGNWIDRGGLWAGDPAAAGNGDGSQVRVAIKDTYNGIWVGTLTNGSTWTWFGQGGIVNGEPSVAMTPAGTFNVAMRAWANGSNLGIGYMLVLGKDQGVGSWKQIGGVWSADLVAGADAYGETVRVAGIDEWGGIWAGEGGYDGAWFSWGYKAGVLARVSAAQASGRFTLYGADSWNGTYRLNLEKDVWSGPHGLASGNPAATGR
ncbi:MAG: hypothetical protein IT168_12180 [Bryobacterales bacterium]|nr:hypothetical protein [Bryobacterales bacterium]